MAPRGYCCSVRRRIISFLYEAVSWHGNETFFRDRRRDCARERERPIRAQLQFRWSFIARAECVQSNDLREIIIRGSDGMGKSFVGSPCWSFWRRGLRFGFCGFRVTYNFFLSLFIARIIVGVNVEQ